MYVINRTKFFGQLSFRSSDLRLNSNYLHSLNWIFYWSQINLHFALLWFESVPNAIPFFFTYFFFIFLFIFLFWVVSEIATSFAADIVTLKWTRQQWNQRNLPNVSHDSIFHMRFQIISCWCWHKQNIRQMVNRQ